LLQPRLTDGDTSYRFLLATFVGGGPLLRDAAQITIVLSYIIQ
jgi:hypothetical protein